MGYNLGTETVVRNVGDLNHSDRSVFVLSQSKLFPPEVTMTETEVHPGRGPRLPHTRISVQDLLPHFKRGESDDQIATKYPTIGIMEIQQFRQYYLSHTDEVLAYEQEVAAYQDDLRKKYHRPSPLDLLSPSDRVAFLKDKLTKKLAAEANGHHPA